MKKIIMITLLFVAPLIQIQAESIVYPLEVTSDVPFHMTREEGAGVGTVASTLLFVPGVNLSLTALVAMQQTDYKKNIQEIVGDIEHYRETGLKSELLSTTLEINNIEKHQEEQFFLQLNELAYQLPAE